MIVQKGTASTTTISDMDRLIIYCTGGLLTVGRFVRAKAMTELAAQTIGSLVGELWMCCTRRFEDVVKRSCIA